MGIFFNRKINLRLTNNINNRLKYKIICFGDSITWGYSLGLKSPKNYPESLKKRIAKNYKKSNISVINEGHCGWTSFDAINYVDNIVKLKPNLVIVMFGINDVLKKTDLKKYLINMKNIIRIIKKSGSAVIILSPTKINKKINKILDIYSKKLLIISRHNGAKIIDIRKIMQKLSDIGGFEKIILCLLMLYI